MKNRDYKIFAPNNFYHVFNRGVGKMDIFKDDQDFKFFLCRLRENLFPQAEGAPLHRVRYTRKALPAEAFSLLCHCLMPNHFHFLIRQNSDLTISKLLAKVCTGYSMYFNKKYERVGTLFQDQFKAVLVDNDSYLLWLSAYIHNNPKIAGLVENLENWQYSSFPYYTGKHQDTLVDKDFILRMLNGNIKQYENFVESASEKIKQRKDLEYLFLD